MRWAKARPPQLRSFATAIQHLIEEKRNIAVIFAGVPHMMDDVANDSVLTFLRRAERYQLQDIPIEDVWEAFETTLSAGGKNASYDALNALARATHGYPFMIQLVGYWAWRQSVVSGHEDFISMVDCESGIAKAKDKLDNLVNAPAVARLSAIARDYLLAMALDDGPSNTGGIAKRLGKTPQYANVYRDWLIREDYTSPPPTMAKWISRCPICASSCNPMLRCTRRHAISRIPMDSSPSSTTHPERQATGALFRKQAS